MMTYYDGGDRGCALAFLTVWLFGVLLTLGFWVFIVWAIYRLVIHFTGGAA